MKNKAKDEVIAFVRSQCRYQISALCKNWPGHAMNKDIGKCPENADGCPYLVIPRKTEGYRYEEENVRS